VFWYVSLDRPMRPVLLRYSAVQSDEKKKADFLLTGILMLVLALLEIIRYLSGLGSWTSLLSLRLCHVVHLRRKCYLPDTLRHLYTIGPFPRKSSLEGWLCLSCSDGLNTKNWRNVYLFYHHGGSGHGGGGQRRGSK